MIDKVLAVRRSKAAAIGAITQEFSYTLDPSYWTVTEDSYHYTSWLTPETLGITVDVNDTVVVSNVINTSTNLNPQNGCAWILETEPTKQNQSARVRFGYTGATNAPSAYMQFSGRIVHNKRGSNRSVFVTGLDSGYPVGSVYISKYDVSPALLFGGTWERITGRFLLATGANGTNSTTYFGSISSGDVNAVITETNGEAWHTLLVEEMPPHNHTQNSHAHNVGYLSKGKSASGRNGPYGQSSSNVGNVSSESKTATNIATGGSSKHNNMPPYYAMYMWERKG